MRYAVAQLGTKLHSWILSSKGGGGTSPNFLGGGVGDSVNCGERGGGYFTKCFGRGVQCMMKKWTQLDLKFWKSKGSKRSKNNIKKRGSTRSKIKGKIATKCLKMVIWQILLENLTNFRQTYFFSRKGESNWHWKKGTQCQWDLKISKKGGQSEGSSLPPSSMGIGSAPPSWMQLHVFFVQLCSNDHGVTTSYLLLQPELPVG